MKVILADDHEPMHDVVRRIVEPELDVVSSVMDGEMLLDAALTLDVNVVITDIAMPGKTGIQAVQGIVGSMGEAAPGVVFLTTYNDPSLVRQALALGTVGYVLKENAVAHLLPAVRTVLAGESYLCPSVNPAGP